MFNFQPDTKRTIEYIAAYSKRIGVNIYFVGGIVRDVLMGQKIKDIDILIEGSAIDFVNGLHEKSLKDCINITIKSIHKDFGTAKTVINGIDIDFASTRKENYPAPGGLPVVEEIGCNILSDLKRRDFTINSIAAKIIYDGSNKLKYELIDPFSGQKDIKLKTLKALHNKSYIDDPTRILRGLDFSLRFCFDFSQNDKMLIQEYLKNPDRKGLSIDRVKLTLKKLFGSNLKAKKAYEKIFDNKFYKIWQETPSFKKEWAENLFIANKIFKIKNCSETFIKSMFDNEIFENKFREATNFEIYKYFKNYKDTELALYYCIFKDDRAIDYFLNLKNTKTFLNGKSLLSLGFKEGKTLGDALDKLLEEKLNHPEKFITIKDEEKFIKAFLINKSAF